MKTQKYKLLILSIAVLVSGVFATPAGATAPANDNFSGATPLVLAGESVSFTTSNAGASKEPGEPDHAENVGGKSVWFKYTPLATKFVRINTVDNLFDTLLAVYTGSSVGDLQMVGYNNDGSPNPAAGGSSTVDLMMTAGVTYYIAVDSLNDQGTVIEGSFRIVLLQADAPFQDGLSSAYNLGYSYRGAIAGSNFSATFEPNEPTAYTAIGNGKSVWYKWTANDSLSVAFEVTDDFDSQIGIYESTVANPAPNQLTKLVSNIDYTGYTPSRRYKTVFFAEANHTYFIQIDGHSVSATQSAVGNFQLKYDLNPLGYSTSFSGFGQKASIGVFRPSEGMWYILPGLHHQFPYMRKWGSNGDTPIGADFNGIGTSSSVAVRNENGQKIWYIGNGGAVLKAFPWGLATDKAVVGDFDRDGRADATVIRNSANGYIWYVRRSRDLSLRVFHFGTTGDKPIIGDFDGDAYTDVSVVRNTPNGLVWYQLLSGFYVAPLYTQTAAVQFGVATDVAAVADFDGDRKTDIGVFRPGTGTWYILRSGTGQVQITQFGAAGDKPQPADYDGDGKADLALFRPSSGDWYFWLSGTDSQDVLHWGIQGDIPVSSLNTLSQ